MILEESEMATSSTWASLLPVVGAAAGYGLGSWAGGYGQLGMSVGGALGGALSSSVAQKTQSEAAAENWDKYAEMMKITPEEETLLINKGKARLSQNYLASNKQLSSTLAGRGLGGGMLATGLADNKRSYDTLVGDLESDVLLKNAGVVPSTMPPVQLGTGDYFAGEMGNMAQQLGGMGAIQSMFETDSEKKKRLALNEPSWISALLGKKDNMDWWTPQTETWGQFGSGRYGTESL
jgi:hypothetical protein